MAVYLVRHAKAAERSTWDADDAERPLTKKGRAQAAALAGLLDGVAVDRIVSSPALRCVETVQPIADRAGVPVEPVPELAEGEPLGPARRMLDRLAGENVVASGHGDLIPALVDALAAEGMTLDGPRACKKGSTWILEVEDGRFARGRYLPPPA